MKILFFNTLSAVNGGAERVLFDTTLELIERGHEVSLVAAYDDRRARQAEFWPSEVNRYYIPELIRPVTDRRAYDSFRRSGVYGNGLRYAQDVIDLEAPDLIHIHKFPSVEVFADLRIDVPMVRTIHSYENLCENRTRRLPDGSVCTHPLGEACRRLCGFDRSFSAMRVRAENRFMKRRVSRLLPVSGYVRDLLVQNGFDRKQLSVIGNFTRMSPVSAPPDQEGLVLFVGRMTPEKGLLELVRAVGKTCSNPRLLAVGMDEASWAGVYRSEIIQEAGRWGVRLETQPWSARCELARAYSRATVVAFSSVWPEPFGLVGIEAMVHEKPVVAFDTGGVREWLKHGQTGFLVPPSDTTGMARVLDFLLANRKLCEWMGHNAALIASQRFSPKVYIDRLINIYNEVTDENTSHRSSRRPAVRDAQCGTRISV